MSSMKEEYFISLQNLILFRKKKFQTNAFNALNLYIYIIPFVRDFEINIITGWLKSIKNMEASKPK